MKKFIAIAISCAAVVAPAGAYNMNSVATPVLSYTSHAYLLDKVSDPVHEIITMLAYNCQANPGACRGQPLTFDRARVDKPIGHLVRGVEWNDDPSLMLSGGAIDKSRWVIWMDDGERIADCIRSGKAGCKTIDHTFDLLYRSHFGDLQFLHAMASRDGEPPAETRRKIMDWAEFSYKVATGAISPETPLSDIKDVQIDKYLRRGSWTPQFLFTKTTGDKDVAGTVYLVALGSLLHMVQDSFSDAHVRRKGSCRALNHNKLEIEEFHNYVMQDAAAHKRADVKPQWVEDGDISDANPVTASAKILRAALQGEDWDKVVKPLLLNDVFKLSDAVRPSSRGDASCFGH